MPLKSFFRDDAHERADSLRFVFHFGAALDEDRDMAHFSPGSRLDLTIFVHVHSRDFPRFGRSHKMRLTSLRGLAHEI